MNSKIREPRTILLESDSRPNQRNHQPVKPVLENRLRPLNHLDERLRVSAIAEGQRTRSLPIRARESLPRLYKRGIRVPGDRSRCASHAGNWLKGAGLSTTDRGMMGTTETCESCRYFKPDHGQCRRNPPIHSESGFSCFPYTTKEEWCGEWRPKVAAEKPKAGNGLVMDCDSVEFRRTADLVYGVAIDNPTFSDAEVFRTIGIPLELQQRIKIVRNDSGEAKTVVLYAPDPDDVPRDSSGRPKPLPSPDSQVLGHQANLNAMHQAGWM